MTALVDARYALSCSRCFLINPRIIYWKLFAGKKLSFLSFSKLTDWSNLFNIGSFTAYLSDCELIKIYRYVLKNNGI